MNQKISECKIITPLIDKYLLMRTKKPRKDGFHPSSLYKCARQIWYAYLKYPPDKTTTAIQERCFDIGHKFESCYTEYFQEMDKLEKKKPGIFNKFKLIGTNIAGENKELEIFYEYDKIVEIKLFQSSFHSAAKRTSSLPLTKFLIFFNYLLLKVKKDITNVKQPKLQNKWRNNQYVVKIYQF